MADPGFLRGGAHPQGGGANLLYGQKLSKNCMNMKEFRPRGGHASLALPLDPPMHEIKGIKDKFCFNFCLQTGFLLFINVKERRNKNKKNNKVIRKMMLPFFDPSIQKLSWLLSRWCCFAMNSSSVVVLIMAGAHPGPISSKPKFI